MNGRSIALGITAVSLAYCGCSQPEEPHVKSQPRSKWQRFRDPDFGLTVLLPKAPSRFKMQVPAHNHEEVTWIVEAEGARYEIGLMRFTPDRSKDRESTLDAIVESYDGVSEGPLLTMERISLHGHPGRHVEWINSDGTASSARSFLVSEGPQLVLYTQTADLPSEEALRSPEIVKYFESLTVPRNTSQ